VESAVSLGRILHNLDLHAVPNTALPHMAQWRKPLDAEHAEAARTFEAATDHQPVARLEDVQLQPLPWQHRI
jgi:hypothetical protein